MIRSKIGSVADGESIWSLYGYFCGFTSIQLSHSLNFIESDKIAIFKTMPRVVQTSYKAFFVLVVSLIFTTYGMNLCTLAMDTIIPDKGCSPVGSTHVKLVPKSLKMDLQNSVKREKKLMCKNTIPKQSTSLCSNKMHAILMCPVIDFYLLRPRCAAKNNNLGLSQC